MPSNKCPLSEGQQRYLMDLALASIRHGLKHGSPVPVDLTGLAAELKSLRATFVTLQIQGQLRGCIGRLEASRPLAEDIADNAYAAAFQDPRFPPLRENELEGLEIHLSLLTPAEPMEFTSEQNLLDQLQPGVDGLILAEGSRRGTFLPSVWEQLPTPGEFLEHLKRKAGLPASHWSDSLKVWRYRTEVVE
ncbi:MAG: AmmeMemoRadiSam system protein A [Proteobacteria bacterium]|nr:AmmeMemoRadiSam system protein A [Pseudomonadota bacterium]